MKQPKEPTFFTYLNQIQSKRRTHAYDKKIANAYMLSQWLAHDKGLIKKVNKLNPYQFILPDEVIYEYYMSVVPDGRRYLKWTKKKKDELMEKRISKLKENNPKLSIRECKMIITYLMNKNVGGKK